jgi:hypothetical protein
MSKTASPGWYHATYKKFSHDLARGTTRAFQTKHRLLQIVHVDGRCGIQYVKHHNVPVRAQLVRTKQGTSRVDVRKHPGCEIPTCKSPNFCGDCGLLTSKIPPRAIPGGSEETAWTPILLNIVN